MSVMDSKCAHARHPLPMRSISQNEAAACDLPLLAQRLPLTFASLSCHRSNAALDVASSSCFCASILSSSFSLRLSSRDSAMGSYELLMRSKYSSGSSSSSSEPLRIRASTRAYFWRFNSSAAASTALAPPPPLRSESRALPPWNRRLRREWPAADAPAPAAATALALRRSSSSRCMADERVGDRMRPRRCPSLRKR